MISESFSTAVIGTPNDDCIAGSQVDYRTGFCVLFVMLVLYVAVVLILAAREQKNLDIHRTYRFADISTVEKPA